jgi:hypothetical protein
MRVDTLSGINEGWKYKAKLALCDVKFNVEAIRVDFWRVGNLPSRPKQEITKENNILTY